MQAINPFEPAPNAPDYHSVYSIQLCELVEGGFDPFGDKRWESLQWYSEEQKSRFEEKFKARFWFRDIGITPPGKWRWELTRVLGEVLPKYTGAYAAIDGGLTPLATQDVYEKERNVYSDFPATQLNASVNDYARNANDREHETVTNGDFIAKMDAIRSRYNDVDAMLLDELEVCFACMMSVSLNLE